MLNARCELQGGISIPGGTLLRLTLHTDYALRCLTYLGLHYGKTCTIREIAQRYDISENHLMKVVHKLGRRGFVETTRGRKGGLRLALSPDDIGVGAVVRATEEDLALAECFDPRRDSCRISEVCALSGIFNTALMAFLNELDRYTLRHLLTPASALAAALNLALPNQDGNAGFEAEREELRAS